MTMSINNLAIFAVPALKWVTPNNASVRAHQISGARGRWVIVPGASDPFTCRVCLQRHAEDVAMGRQVAGDRVRRV